jgi:hypothetical protein
MKRIIISEQKITQEGQVKFFQIALPKTTKKVIAIATDLRMELSPALRVISGSTIGIGELSRDAGGSDTQWDINTNPLAGRLIMQSMEKANIFFCGQVWALTFDDGFSGSDGIDSMNAFTVLYKPQPKTVDVPGGTTLLNCLYRDTLAASLRGAGYTIKVLVWIECEE